MTEQIAQCAVYHALYLQLRYCSLEFLKIYLLGAKYGFGLFADFSAQTSDRQSAQRIRGSHISTMHNTGYAIHALCMVCMYQVALDM